ncbi:polyketide synthase family protein [Thioploca ingrica]|uniref:Polyketide synthase family protein n=1 Tax=Thioploca ingrica TaxID=40754 RepID=A0A090ACB4_9GAMM|nr:polyketide synthase family protein [Thioploca ingrica]
MSERIAIIGMACRYPEADNPKMLWENTLAQRRAFRRLPAERLNLADYFSTDRTLPDAVYCDQAAVIEGYEFDRLKYRISGHTYRSTDLTHWLALDIAAQALEDAGFPDGQGLVKERTGVLVGNTLTGEFSRAALMRLRWPYVRRMVDAQLRKNNWTAESRATFLADLEIDYKQPFEPVGEETLAGGLSNTIAGRICNHFDLGGGGYTLDGACSSSLLALANACNALVTGDLDTAVVGGVDLSLDPFELIGFAKTAALAATQMRVYDAAANGFWPGEGCGFVILMRYEDALACGARCYTLIRGWGISSDGGGGITRPEEKGQRLALERAYQRAGYGIDTVPLFEGHGTGTTVGDQVELQTLMSARRAAHSQGLPAAISSIKANIGHTKAAAGIAGILKAVMAIHNQILPPATAVAHPHPLLQANNANLRLLSGAEVWPAQQSLRAGVSSFGFGGINVHVTLEGINGIRRTQLTSKEQQLIATPQENELFLLGAEDFPALAALLSQLAQLAPRLSFGELTDLAARLAQQDRFFPVRAALIAATPTQLADKLEQLWTKVTSGEQQLFDQQAGIFLAVRDQPPRITLLFPGQAAPVRLTGGIWSRRFPQITALYQQAILTDPDNDLNSTAVAQPAIITAAIAGLQILATFGITGQLAVGHSLGEFAALYWANAMDEATLLKTVQVRGQAMTDVAAPAGAMLSLAVDEATAQAWCTKIAGINIAGLNSPSQTVVSGEKSAIIQLQQQAQTQGITATLLPVAHGFHSPLMLSAAEELATHLAPVALQPLQRRVISTITGQELEPQVNWKELLIKQMTQPVRFSAAIQQVVPETDLFVEVGPGQILTNLVHQTTAVPVIPLDIAGSSFQGLLTALGAAYVMGAPLNREALFADRLVRPFSLDWQPQFFVNPCELAPLPDAAISTTVVAPVTKVEELLSTAAQAETAESQAQLSILERLRQAVAKKAELPPTAVHNHSRLLADLHLNSITVGQIVAEVSRQLGLAAPVDPTAYASATVAQIAQAMEDRLASGEAEANPTTTLPAGVDAWIRAFTVTYLERPRRGNPLTPQGQGGWQVFGDANHPLKVPLEQQLNSWGGGGVALCLPADVNENHIGMMLAAAQAVLELTSNRRYFILVQTGNSAAAFARTLHREQPNLTTVVITLPLLTSAFDQPTALPEKSNTIAVQQALEHILAELHIAKGYHEVRYDLEEIRYERWLQLLPSPNLAPTLPLTAADILLVSGGGKGITAECAAALARETGVKLVLLGRASPDQDHELAENLARFQAMGLIFKYCQTDVTNETAVKATIAEIVPEWGAITALLHGAGTNQPTLLRHLDAAAFQRTLAPKVGGLRHLLNAIDPQQLRLLISFGSFIAPAGMPGEADYAVANEWLAALTEAHQQAYPHCRCLTLEWTVWSEVGMGKRLGSDETLAQQGITPISPEVGISILRQALLAQNWPKTVIISGRMPEVPTLRLEHPDLPFLRFLEHPRVYYPGIELVVEAELSPVSDPYLNDHVFKGQSIFPAVMGLEAMAQVAATVLGVKEIAGFDQVEFARPVVVAANQAEIVQIAALVREPGKVDVVLRCAQTGFKVNHFQARCLVSDAISPTTAIATKLNGKEIPLELEPYGELLFQTGRFKRIRSYQHLEATQCIGEIAAADASPWFGRYLPPTLLLGDPGSRDAAIHAIQACIPHAQLLPIAVERLTLVDIDLPGPWTLSAQERWRQGDRFCYDFVLQTPTGQIREIWEGLHLHKVSVIPWQTGWQEALLAPYVERRLQELIPAALLRVALHHEITPDRSLRRDQAFQKLLGSPLEIVKRPDGKPEIPRSDWKISAAHAGDFTLTVAGTTAVACDLEPVVKREKQTWLDLLGNHYDLIKVIDQDTHETSEKAATRIWTARECLKKAGALLETPLTIKESAQDGWILFAAGEMTIASAMTTLKSHEAPLALAILVGK